MADDYGQFVIICFDLENRYYMSVRKESISSVYEEILPYDRGVRYYVIIDGFRHQIDDKEYHSLRERLFKTW